MLTFLDSRSPSAAGRGLWLAVATLVAGAAIACGDLVIPNNGETSDAGSVAGDAGAVDDGAAFSSDDAAVPVSADGAARPNCDGGVYPIALACTGLYTDWAQRALAPDVRSYQLDPRTVQWVDGASEKEWIWLPPNQKITTVDPNNWVFPNGTKFWQELSLLGARIETRFLWKLSTGQWFRTTFVWSADQTAAPSMTAGTPNASGIPYEIPSVRECDTCHQGAADYVLGYEIVGLSLPGAMGLDVAALKQENALSNPPSALLTLPAGDPVAPDGAGALGPSLAYLHANCGTSCHNRNVDANAGPTGLFLKLTVDATGALPRVEATDTWTTSVGVPSRTTPAGATGGGFLRVRPGDAAHSTIPYTMARRNNGAQMPPIGSELVDQNAVLTLTRWINGLSADAGAPAPSDAGTAPISAVVDVAPPPGPPVDAADAEVDAAPDTGAIPEGGSVDGAD